MAGHLFIVRGDLMRLHCDARLVPSGFRARDGGHVRKHWGLSGPGIERVGPESIVTALRGVQAQTASASERLIQMPEAEGEPSTWVAHTGEGGHAEDPEWFVAPVVEFIRGAGVGARHTQRERPLLAFPLVGTGEGGIAADKGGLITALLKGVRRALTETEADAVFVARNREAFAAASHLRAHQLEAGWWGELGSTSEWDEVVESVAREARRDRLVVFLGAGVSAGAGLPSWEKLVEDLEQDADISEEDRRGLVLPDRAELVVRKLGPEGLRGAVKENLGGHVQVSLQHQLLATLPVTEAATTNYDGLFELAWKDALFSGSAEDRSDLPAVIKGGDPRNALRWLLKLHGSLTNDEEPMVLTASDFFAFESRSGVLGSVLQSMLVTRHMLFVGFSFADPNFQRLAFGIEELMGGDRDKWPHWGTVLTADEVGGRRALWKGRVRFLSTRSPTQGRSDSSEEAGDRSPTPAEFRQVEILLDRIVADATVPVAFIRDDAYAAVLDESLQGVSRGLGELERIADQLKLDGKHPATAEALRRMMRPFSPDDRAWRDRE